MDRELVLAILVALLCGSALTAVGWWPVGSAASNGCADERRSWLGVWLPLLPAALLFAALCGWALVEPEAAERMPNCLLLGALPFAAVLLRAAWRALRAATRAQKDNELSIATVGLLRPRIVVCRQLA